MKRILFDNLKLSRLALEIRYPKGYRYWDVCGKCILDLNDKTGGELDFKQLEAANECRLLFKTHPRANASFGFAHMTMGSTMLHNVTFFAEYAPLIFDVVSRNLEITHISRIGVRFWLVYPTDDKDEANSIIREVGLCEVSTKRLAPLADEVVTAMPVLILRYDDTNIRLTIEAASRQQDYQLSGEEEEPFFPSHCLLVDMDFYKEDIPVDKVDLAGFITSAYRKISHNIATLLKPE